jgi:hypothetical protein
MGCLAAAAIDVIDPFELFVGLVFLAALIGLIFLPITIFFIRLVNQALGDRRWKANLSCALGPSSIQETLEIR